ncbi:Serine/threonine kinase [Tulasnella sp. 408]|nr:Serine/threonine kinase [Tulasnella sp. 408]
MSSGDSFQPRRATPPGWAQPNPQQQRVQEHRFKKNMVATNDSLAENHTIEMQQRMPLQPQPRRRPLPPLPNVPQSPPQQMEQITSGINEMSMQDRYRQPPPVEVQPPLPPSYGRPDQREPARNRYDHGAATAPQQRFPVTRRESQRPEREEMDRRQPEEQEPPPYYAQRQQQIQQQQQREPPLPMYLYPPSDQTPGAYHYGSRHSSGALPAPKAYPPQPVAHPNPRYTYAQQQPPAAAEGPQPQPQRQQVQQHQTKREVGLDDFNFMAVIGRGDYGKVLLAEEKKTNHLFAIKILKKKLTIDNDEIESIRSMKRHFLVNAQARHPFLLGFHACFQTETRIYFVMEYVIGGNLMHNLQQKQFSLRQAKFYAQEILLAVEYLHSQGIIHRNVTLENVLLTLDGHVKVAGYYLCKSEMWYGCRTGTFCGTPESMAPEILLEQMYGRAVDWWAFGVLVYQMLLGQSPFRGDDEDELFDAILDDEPLYPVTMPRDAVSMLQKLLTRDPNQRLGSGRSDAEEIALHPFFKDTNWEDVLNKRIPPPYVPIVTSAADTSNFDAQVTREQPMLTPVLGRLSAKEQAEFQDFSWTADWADL